jgi:putative heme-binding domain-containing protein
VGDTPGFFNLAVAGNEDLMATFALALLAKKGTLDERAFVVAQGFGTYWTPAIALDMLDEKDREGLLKGSLDGTLSEGIVRAGVLAYLTKATDVSGLWQSCEAADPFVAQAARFGLARLKVVTPNLDRSKLTASQRLSCLLILREASVEANQAAIPSFLADVDPAVRFAALQWVGEEKLSRFRGEVNLALTTGEVNEKLFSAFLATLEKLDGAKRDAGNEWAGEQYIVQALKDDKSPTTIRRWALRVMPPDHVELTTDRLLKLISSDDAALALEAVKTLRASQRKDRDQLLLEIAGRESTPVSQRAEAAGALGGDDSKQRSLLMQLAAGDQPALRDEALRSLRGITLDTDELAQLKQIKPQPDVNDLIQRIVDPSAKPERPPADDLAAWEKLLSTNDRSPDAAAGERIFFHGKSAGCAKCHQMSGRGGKVGPDLSTTAKTLDRRRLLQSILKPSAEVAPQFTEWLITTTDGRTLTGMLLDAKEGEQTYGNSKGETFKLREDQIEVRQAQQTSIMPDGLADLLTLDEFRDLLAYLSVGK